MVTIEKARKFVPPHNRREQGGRERIINARRGRPYKLASERFPELSDDEMDRMNRLLRRKLASCSEMARMIQNEWGKHTDLSHSTLAKRLTRYYNIEFRVRDSVAQAFAGGNKGLYQALNLSKAHLDVLGELSDVYGKHKELLDKLYLAHMEEEGADMRKWNAAVRETAGLLKLLIGTYMDIGLIERKPKQSQLRIHATSDKEALDFESMAAEQGELEQSTRDILRILGGVPYKDVTETPALPSPEP